VSRTVVTPASAQLLAAHRAAVEARGADLCIALEDDAFIFSLQPDGSRPLLPRYVTQRYRRMAIHLRLRSTRLHALRHYSATEFLAASVDLRTVDGRLGHGAGGATTLKVYATWVEQADRKAAETVTDILPRPKPRALRGRLRLHRRRAT
jgi:integrase